MSDLPDDFVPDYDPLIWGGTKGIGDWQDKYVQMCRIANEQRERIEQLEGLVTEAVGVCDDLIAKTDCYLGINDAYKRHDLWEKRVQALASEAED